MPNISSARPLFAYPSKISIDYSLLPASAIYVPRAASKLTRLAATRLALLSCTMSAFVFTRSFLHFLLLLFSAIFTPSSIPFTRFPSLAEAAAAFACLQLIYTCALFTWRLLITHDSHYSHYSTNSSALLVPHKTSVFSL